ncbi:MAG: tetratricopeptide repeat protein, partial [bacterium]
GRPFPSFGGFLSRLGFCLWACLCFAVPARAVGPYFFVSLGERQVSGQDMADFFAYGTQQQPQFVPSYLGEAYITAGYRFTDPFALELAGGAQMGREESGAYSALGDVDLQVPSGALSLVSIAPVFCFETFESVSSTWLNQVGLRLEYAQVSGSETLDTGTGLSSLNFNGQTLGCGLFYRLVNLWAPKRLSVGLETGYELLRFDSLASGNPTGVFVGGPGRVLQNLNGSNAFLDNSGPYVRLVIGWAKDSSTELQRTGGTGRAARDERAAQDAALLAAARAAERRGDNAAALEHFRDYLSLRPRDASAWRDLGALYLRYGKKDFAARCFEDARRASEDSR